MTIHVTAPTRLIDSAALDDLKQRIMRTRLHDSAAQQLGTSNLRLRALVDQWQNAFAWNEVEATMTELGSATTMTTDGRRLHYLHRPAADRDQARLPLLLLHGWPDTSLQFGRLMPLLADAGHPVVAPTSPGFGFSDEPQGELSPQLVAADVHRLMAELGYARYLVHATDWGATVASALAGERPGAVAALHLLQPPFDRAFQVDRTSASAAEQTYLEHMDRWSDRAAYVTAHMLQADTLAAAFTDSPVGLLAWLADKYDAWSGDGIRDEDIIANTATMWLTATFRSSVRLYSEPAADWDTSGSGDWGAARIEIPTAFAIFPDDIGMPPREFAERFFAVQRFTVMPRGGHWAALEEPQLLADDLLAFAADVS